MTIAVDFDGTIVEHRYPNIGKERPFAFDVLKKLQKEGHKLILWTAREGRLLEDAVKFCHDNGLDFYAVNSDGPAITDFANAGITRKLRVDLFIDDRNLGGLPDWPTIYRMVKGKMNWPELFGREDNPEDEEGFFRRLIRRCKSARSRVRGGGDKTLKTPRKRHHW